MEQLGHVSCGWPWIERQLNRIIDCVNARGVIPSATVAVQETPAGCLLSVQQGAQSGQQATENSGGSVPGPVTWNDVGWKYVTVVDPDTCEQSQIQVLTIVPGGSVDIQ